jgi:hypothetical protein
MPIGNSEEAFRKITIVDEISSLWALSEGRIPVIMKRHAQMYFLPLNNETFEKHLEILNAAWQGNRPIRIMFIEHGGEIVSVGWPDPDGGRPVDGISPEEHPE